MVIITTIVRTITSTTEPINKHSHRQLLPYFDWSTYSKPKDQSKGEDAYYTSKSMICVADGVGGWNQYGIDPSKYSNELICNYSSLYNKELQSNRKIINDIALFAKSCHMTHSIGSSTFCALRIDSNDFNGNEHKVISTNLGDSGYMSIRNNKLLFKSKEQQHSFNFPFQVGTNGDSPLKAEVRSHLIEQGDIVIAATDGLWDNMYEEQLINIIKYGKEKKSNNGEIIKQIGDMCYKQSITKNYISPFSKNSNLRYFGGKPDDITIILAEIKCLH